MQLTRSGCTEPAFCMSPLRYGSDSWTAYSGPESRLNSFRLLCLRLMLQISRKGRVPAGTSQANTRSMFGLPSQRRLHWLGHVGRMQDGPMPTDILCVQSNLWNSLPLQDIANLLHSSQNLCPNFLRDKRPSRI